jgi:hypothetical protein
MKHFKRLFPITISTILVLSACGPVTPIPSATATRHVQATSTEAPSSTPSPTATNTPIPTATPVRSCPTLNQTVQFSFSEDFAPFETSMLEYLNAGGDPDQLKALLEKKGNFDFSIGAGDITGDDQPEVVVITDSFFEGNSQQGQAQLRIYQCAQNSYEMVKALALGDDRGGGWVEMTERVFAKENPYIILHLFSIRGWGSNYVALNWHDGDWQMISLGGGFFPEIAFMDQDHDGIKEVFIRSDTSTPPGGGVGRYVIDTYQWDGKKFKSTHSEFPPALDRIHYIEDAQDAWEKGNPFMAISYYEIAARNTWVSSYPTPYEIINRQSHLAGVYQRAFSYFRIVAIWLSLGRPENALEYRDRMSDVFPAKKPGNEFVLAVDEMIKAYPELKYPKACHAAAQFLDEKYPGLFTNHLGDWGALNITYSKTLDMCAFGQ